MLKPWELFEDHLRRTFDPLGVFEDFVLPVWLDGLDWIDRQLYAFVRDLDA